MSEKKFSPEDVLKILRACNSHGLTAQKRCAACPASGGGCTDFGNEEIAADAIEELLAQVRWVPVGERLPDAELDEIAKHINLALHWPGFQCLAMIRDAKYPTILNYADIDGDRVWVTPASPGTAAKNRPTASTSRTRCQTGWHRPGPAASATGSSCASWSWVRRYRSSGRWSGPVGPYMWGSEK